MNQGDESLKPTIDSKKPISKGGIDRRGFLKLAAKKAMQTAGLTTATYLGAAQLAEIEEIMPNGSPRRIVNNKDFPLAQASELELSEAKKEAKFAAVRELNTVLNDMVIWKNGQPFQGTKLKSFLDFRSIAEKRRLSPDAVDKEITYEQFYNATQNVSAEEEIGVADNAVFTGLTLKQDFQKKTEETNIQRLPFEYYKLNISSVKNKEGEIRNRVRIVPSQTDSLLSDDQMKNWVNALAHIPPNTEWKSVMRENIAGEALRKSRALEATFNGGDRGTITVSIDQLGSIYWNVKRREVPSN